MPRYFFHTEDGQCFPDENGAELADEAAARVMALRTMCEMSDALQEDVWRRGSLQVKVCDASGAVLMRVDLQVSSGEG